MPVRDILFLIESIVNDPFGVCIFNATFDSFHLVKLYNTLRLLGDKNKRPDPEEFFLMEKISWENAVCLKPYRCFDPYLLLKKTVFQEVFNKKPILIRSVPCQAAHPLIKELEKVKLHPLLFAKGGGWKIKDAKDRKTSKVSPDFVDIELKFHASLGLKPIIKFLFNMDVKQINVPDHLMPKKGEEDEWNPFGFDWRPYLKGHIEHWRYNSYARQYAADDITYLDMLVTYIRNHPGINIQEKQPTLDDKTKDIDSELAWAVGAARHRGFAIDNHLTERMIYETVRGRDKVPTAPAQSRQYISAVIPEMLRPFFTSTGDKVLERLVRENPETEYANRAKEVIDARSAEKQLDILRKLNEVGRFHPDFSITGTLTNRMSGSGGFNAQGIPKESQFRALFIFASNEDSLCGGDFEGQEVTIFDALVGDKELHKELLAKKKFHALLAAIYYELSYEDVLKPENRSKYDRTKNSVFASFYGAEIPRLAETLNLSHQVVEERLKKIYSKYPGIGEYRKSNYDQFCSMRQPAGIGTKVVWHEPAGFVGSIFGFRRFFTTENILAKFLFDLSNNLSRKLSTFPRFEGIRVRRKAKDQSVVGATQSALYGAAFGIQAKNLRIANNHQIQASGAYCTKLLQWRIWDQAQPQGVHEWLTQVFNVHDEVISVTHPEMCETVEEIVNEVITELREKVPLISIKWKSGVTNWNELK